MAWNITLLFVKADQTEAELVMPDVMSKTEENLYFEDVSSVMMGNALGVSWYNGWFIICDVQDRYISNDYYTCELSEQYDIKVFLIAEDMIYREYSEGTMTKEISGKKEGGAYLESKGIAPLDGWGETRIIQIMEAEMFTHENQKGWDIIFQSMFDKYELDT